MTTSRDGKALPHAEQIAQSHQEAHQGRRARKRAASRQRLLAAARGVFAREGLASATIATITQEADLGFGTFYLYFTTKEDAYRAVVTEGFDDLAERLRQARQGAFAVGALWWEVVRAVVATYYTFASENRDLVVAMFAGGDAGIGLGRTLQERFAEGLAATLGTVARQPERAEGIYPYPPGPVAIAVIAALTRAILWWLAHDASTASADSPPADRLTLNALIDTMTRFAVAALAGQMPVVRDAAPN